MGHAPTGPPDHASDHRHELASGDAEGFSDRVAMAARWVRRWVKGSTVPITGPIKAGPDAPIVVVTKAMPAPGVEPGSPSRGEGF
jgi:hypothetical protein